MKRFLLLLSAMLLLAIPALAEDVFAVDASEAVTASSDALTTDRSYLRVTCPLNGEAPVTLSIADGSGTLCYQRAYGPCEESFRSEDIYLRLTGSTATYQVSLQAGDALYAFPVHLTMRRLTGNAACSVGLPLRDLTGADTWKSATLLDVAALDGSSLTVPLHASGAYEIGTATFAIQNGDLTVSVRLNEALNGTIDRASIQAATTALEAQQLGRKNFRGPTGQLNTPIPLNNTPYAAIYLNLTVSFDPASAPSSPSTTLNNQPTLWDQMQTTTANEAVG